MHSEIYIEQPLEFCQPITGFLPQGTGIQFVVREDGFLLGATKSGKDFLQTSNVLGLENSFITFRQDTWAARFKVAITKGENTVLILTDDTTNTAYALQVRGRGTVWCNVKSLSALKSSSYAVYGLKDINVDFLNSFGLTAAERRIVSYLAVNCSLEEIGEILKIRHETVRTHKRRIFAKIGVSSTNELLALVIFALA